MFPVRFLVIALVLGVTLGGCNSGGDSMDDTASGTSVLNQVPATSEMASCNALPRHDGKAAYYDATGSGNCSLEPTNDSMLVAALNAAEYGIADWCGACAKVTGPLGSVIVQIVDRCPECGIGELDLSGAAFTQIANPADGRVSVNWQIVSCDTDANITLRFKEGSSLYWASVQVRDHANPLASLEYKNTEGNYVALTRTDYNYFISNSGLGNEGPFDFRVTDIFGERLEVSNVALLPEQDQRGTAQFAMCSD